MCFCHSIIQPEARVIEPAYHNEDLKILGLRFICTWAQWSTQSSIYVFRDLEDDALQPDTPESDAPTNLVPKVQVTAPTDTSTNVIVYFRHSSNPAASLQFNSRQNVFWLSLSMTDEPQIIQSLREAYGFAIDLVENIMMAEWCWREQSVPEMAQILDASPGFNKIPSNAIHGNLEV